MIEMTVDTLLLPTDGREPAETATGVTEEAVRTAPALAVTVRAPGDAAEPGGESR